MLAIFYINSLFFSKSFRNMSAFILNPTYTLMHSSLTPKQNECWPMGVTYGQLEANVSAWISPPCASCIINNVGRLSCQELSFSCAEASHPLCCPFPRSIIQGIVDECQSLERGRLLKRAQRVGWLD